MSYLGDRHSPEPTVQLHLYPLRNVLNPRGGLLAKESLGQIIYEHLISTFEHWTDPQFGDNPTIDELLRHMRTNLDREVRLAWNTFHVKAKES